MTRRPLALRAPLRAAWSGADRGETCRRQARAPQGLDDRVTSGRLASTARPTGAAVALKVCGMVWARVERAVLGEWREAALRVVCDVFLVVCGEWFDRLVCGLIARRGGRGAHSCCSAPRCYPAGQVRNERTARVFCGANGEDSRRTKYPSR